jgi:hypothetical protein
VQNNSLQIPSEFYKDEFCGIFAPIDHAKRSAARQNADLLWVKMQALSRGARGLGKFQVGQGK